MKKNFEDKEKVDKLIFKKDYSRDMKKTVKKLQIKKQRKYGKDLSNRY